MGPLRSFSWCMKKEQNKAKHKYISLGKKRPEKKQRHERYLSGEIRDDLSSSLHFSSWE